MFNTLLTKYIKFFRLYSEDTSYENLADLKLLTEKLLAYLIPGIFLIIFVAYFLANTITFFIVIATWLSLIIIFLLNRVFKYEKAFLYLYILFSVDMIAFILINDGIRDIALFFYPAIIIFTAFVLDTRLFLQVSIGLFLILMSIAIAEYFGIIVRPLSKYVTPLFLADMLMIIPLLIIIIYTMIKNAQLRQRKLAESNRTKDRFLKILAHDLRNPFQSMMGISNVIVEEYDELSDDEKKQLLLHLRNGISDQYKLLDKLLQWGKLQAGVYSPNFVKVDISKIIKEIIILSSSIASEKNITIINTIDEENEVLGDEFVLTTAFRNIIQNSIKFTPHEGKIVVEANSQNEVVQVVISDSGKGIAIDKLDFINDSTRYDSLPESGGDLGTGLGLMLVKEAVLIHKGTLIVDSEVGKGTTFKLTFNK
jgi:signal transduction histidine kinase